MFKLMKHIVIDLTADRHRALLSLAAIIIGMSAFGIILFSRTIIIREIPAVYSDRNPASASILVETADQRLQDITDQFTAIDNYEVTGSHNLRIRTTEGDKTLELFAAEDYSDKMYGRLKLLDGDFEIGKKEALIEGDAVKVAKAGIGDKVTLLLADGTAAKLQINGSVNDLSVHPATMHNVVYLYVDFQTLASLDLEPNKIEFTVSGDKYDRDHILRVCDDYIVLLEQHGYQVKGL